MNHYFDNAHITTQAVPNPSYDGRRKYGPESIKEVPAGTVLFSFKNADRMVSYYDEKGNALAYTGEFAKELGKHLEDFEPTTWKQVLVKNFGAIYPGQLADIMTELAETGAVTIGQIIRAAKVVHDKSQD